MKGFIKKTLAALFLVGGLSVFTGCSPTYQDRYHNYVDPCWVQRYSAMAADATNAAFAPQVENGHILDQTVWNHHFELGRPELTPGGQMRLAYLARRRPAPDPRIFVQTSYDVSYDAEDPGKFAEDRGELDLARTQAVYAYLQAQTAGRPINFHVTVHDPGEVGLHSAAGLKTTTDFHSSFRGMLPMMMMMGGMGGGGMGGMGGGGGGMGGR